MAGELRRDDVRCGAQSRFLGALGDLVLGQGRQESCGRPAFPVGTFGEARPDVLDGWQAQIVEHDRETGDVDAVRAEVVAGDAGAGAEIGGSPGHAASP